MGRDALPPRDPSSIVFESSQQRRSFVIDPVASKAAGSSGEPEIVESTGPSSDGVSSRRWPWGIWGCPRRLRWSRSVPYHDGVGFRPCPEVRPHPRRLGLPLGTSSRPTSGSTGSGRSLPPDIGWIRVMVGRRANEGVCGGSETPSPLPITAHNAQTPSRAPRRKAHATTAFAAKMPLQRGVIDEKLPRPMALLVVSGEELWLCWRSLCAKLM